METPSKSACSTAIIANTVVSRQSRHRQDLLKKMALLRLNTSRSARSARSGAANNTATTTTTTTTTNDKTNEEEGNETKKRDDTREEVPSKSSTQFPRRSNEMKKQSSFLDRLRVVKTNSSLLSSRRKQQEKISVTRNNKGGTLPKELVLIAGQDSISLMPDSYSNSTGNNKEQTEKEVLASSNIDIYSQPASLFTFDLVPSTSEEESYEGNTNSTVYTKIATIQRNDSWLSLLDQPESNSRNNMDAENDKSSDNNVKEDTKTNDEEVTSDKLNLELRSRTHSTALLSEASSRDTLSYEGKLLSSSDSLVGSLKDSKMANDNSKNEGSSSGKNVDSKKGSFRHNTIHENASRCISFDILSLFGFD